MQKPDDEKSSGFSYLWSQLRAASSNASIGAALHCLITVPSQTHHSDSSARCEKNN